MADNTTKTNEQNNLVFDTRVVIKGKKAQEVRKCLDKKMEAENRTTYGNAIADILLKHFKIK